jgi:hypothetical protein
MKLPSVNIVQDKIQQKDNSGNKCHACICAAVPIAVLVADGLKSGVGESIVAGERRRGRDCVGA